MKIIINYFDDESIIKSFIESFINKTMKGHSMKRKEIADKKRPGLNHLYITVCKETKK